MALRDALDQAVQTEASQVIGHSPHGVLGWVQAQQLSQQGSHFLIGKTPELETEQDQHAEQCLHVRIAEPQSRGSLSGYFNGTDYLFKRVFANRTIVGYSLDVQETSVGLKADTPQFWQVLQ